MDGVLKGLEGLPTWIISVLAVLFVVVLLAEKLSPFLREATDSSYREERKRLELQKLAYEVQSAKESLTNVPRTFFSTDGGDLTEARPKEETASLERFAATCLFGIPFSLFCAWEFIDGYSDAIDLFIGGLIVPLTLWMNCLFCWLTPRQKRIYYISIGFLVSLAAPLVSVMVGLLVEERIM